MNFLISLLSKLAVLVAAFFAGKESQKKAQLQDNLDDVAKAKEINHEVANIGYGAVDQRLIDNNWMRPDQE